MASNEIENNYKVNNARIWFFEKMNEVDKLTRLLKKNINS